MESVLGICKVVLKRLSEMDYERKGGRSKERLIFPNTFPSEAATNKGISEKKLLTYTRVSEQELRFLFLEEFLKKPSNGYYYSVETPTKEKYRFGKTNDDIKIDPTGRSASIDLCVFERNVDKYNRVLNIEFKNANASKKSISKDILKLIHEKEDGAFILLLKNTNAGTLNNLAESRDGVVDKVMSSLTNHNNNELHWKGDDKKLIEIIIISLEEKDLKTALPFLYYCTINKNNLDNLHDKAIIWRKEVLDGDSFKNYSLV